MSNRMDKILNSRFTTVVLGATAVAAGVLLIGGGSLFEGDGDQVDEKRVAVAEVEQTPVSPPEAIPAESKLENTPAEGVVEAKPTANADTPPVVKSADSKALTPASSDYDATPQTKPVAPVPKAKSAAQAEEPEIVVAAAPGGANSFNRLLKKPASAPNAPPARDGIHDPSNPGTALLQWPSVAFEGLPHTSDGNKVDWVKALNEEKIAPRYELDNPKADPFILDLVIIRQVKGSMPNVVYPHLQHTQWLDCSNCHDEIFTPQKGANQISMAGILLGQKCGVCHGKVAFPVSDCRRCHAQPKTAEELKALADRSSWATGGD